EREGKFWNSSYVSYETILGRSLSKERAGREGWSRQARRPPCPIAERLDLGDGEPGDDHRVDRIGEQPNRCRPPGRFPPRSAFRVESPGSCRDLGKSAVDAGHARSTNRNSSETLSERAIATRLIGPRPPRGRS